MRCDVEKVKKLLKRLPYDQIDGIVDEAKHEMHIDIVNPILSFCGTFSFWNQKNLSCVIDNKDVVILTHVHPDNSTSRYWIDDLKIVFTKSYIDIGSTLRVWPDDGMCYGHGRSSQYDIVKELLVSDVDGQRIISHSCPLMLIAFEIRRLFAKSRYYTRLTLLCVQRHRKAFLSRDVLIYLLKIFIV